MLASPEAVYEGQNYAHCISIHLRYPQSVSTLVMTGTDRLQPAEILVTGTDVNNEHHLLLDMPKHLLFAANSTFSHTLRDDVIIRDLHIYIQSRFDQFL